MKILRHSIKDEKALGLAEALLIGYKNDLDKNYVRLLQPFTSTRNVFKIIALGCEQSIR